ncbi:MAG: hypothetical protein JSR98_22020 [Proteobacteria bacterium]|nr:hypothetical protein [Pseudomonadota bacterium]
MPKDVDRFLARAPILEEGPSLGRVFAVVCESWLLSEDPRAIAPRAEPVASRRTALEAADLAREAAEAFERHGFHKPSGAWWGSDGVRLHRFAVRPAKPAPAGGLILGSGLAALGAVAALALIKAAWPRGKRPLSRA